MKITAFLPKHNGFNQLPMKRIGRFRITREMIEKEYLNCVRVMEGIVVIRAEHMLETDTVEYIAISKYFEPVPVGQLAPLYEATLHTVGGVVEKVEWYSHPEKGA